MFLPDSWGSWNRIMNLDSLLIKTCNISKLISIPIFTLQSKNYIIFMIIITKIILAMPERDSTKERKLFNYQIRGFAFVMYISPVTEFCAFLKSFYAVLNVIKYCLEEGHLLTTIWCCSTPVYSPTLTLSAIYSQLKGKWLIRSNVSVSQKARSVFHTSPEIVPK